MLKQLLYLLFGFVLFIVQPTKTQAQIKGSSSSQTPYVLPVASGVKTTSILSVQDAPGGYGMVGIPDGGGAFDNGNGTFTLLLNHELGNTAGVTRAHGGIGSFVSKWIINKSDLSVVNGFDLIQSVYSWNTISQSSGPAITPNFNRFCSGDLPAASAFYNPATGLGSTARIYMHGEEGGATGYQVATVATGPDAGKCYILGKFNLSTNGSGLTGTGGWENALANPYVQDKTIVVGNNDGGTGIMNNSVAVYIGTKTNTGTEVDKAGLTNGILKFINVTGSTTEIINTTTRATNITSGTSFTLSGTSSTTFSRPEDGAWDPLHPYQFYFVTTDRLDQVSDGIGSQIGRTRLWRLNFTDITNPELGGTIDLLLNGTEGPNMMDNLGVDHWGHLLLQEDVGNAAHNGKIWQYTIATGELKLIAKHDPARFGDIGLAATAPFNQDEESSGIFDVQDILGAGMFLMVDQAHYGLPSPYVEGGQILALYNPDTYTNCSDYTATIGVSPSPTVAGQLVNTIYKGYGPQSVTLTASVATGFPPYTYSWTPTNETTSSITISPDVTTSYTVTIKNAFGCATTATQEIQVIDIRDGDKDKVFICHEGNTISVSVSAVPAHLAHGDLLGNCAVNRTPLSKITIEPNEDIVSVYPNPASTTAVINITLLKESKVDISVVDASGRKALGNMHRNLNAGSNQVKLDVSSLVNGIYMVEVNKNDTKTIQKLMIRH